MNQIKLFYSFTIIILLNSCGMKAQDSKEFTTTSSSSYNNGERNDSISLPENYVNIIDSVKFVTWYILDSGTDLQDTNSKLNGWEILSCKEDCLAERIGALSSTLTYPESFPKTDYVKECTFLPDIAIAFTKETDTLIVSYSFYCDLCRFQIRDQYKDYDGELIRKDLLQFALELFPNDKYLRQLNRRNR